MTVTTLARVFCILNQNNTIMKRRLLAVACFFAAISATYAHKTSPEWIKNAVVYDIYPCSFMDSDGNGIGDLQGIISRLDYIKSLGVSAIWMNPIYKSGWFDGGYDVIDYYTVDPRFGQNKDVKTLVEEAHKRDIKVLLDLVPGHTSDKAEWFRRSATEGPDGRYADYYIWSDKISKKDSADIAKRMKEADPATSKRGTWVPVENAFPEDGKYTAAFFQKNYYPCQPALNFGYANPDPSKKWQQSPDAPGPKATRRELKNIMAYWFDYAGVDGFRVDLAGSLVKNDKDGTATGKLWSEMRDFIDREYPGKVLLSEWGNPEVAIPAGFDMDFPLLHKFKGYRDLMTGAGNSKKVGDNAYFAKAGKGIIKDFVNEYVKKYQASRDYGYISFFSSNHDVNRVNSESRDTPDQHKVVMTFLLTMPGVPFIHYGDEISMRNVRGLPSVEGSREERSGTRTPMQWDDTPSVGFSTAAPENLFLPTFTDGGKLTVAAQDKDPKSTLNYVRNLIALRHRHPALANAGDWQLISDPDMPYPMVYSRTTTDGETYIVALNPAGRKVSANVPANGKLTLLESVGKPTAKIKSGMATISMPEVSSAIYKVEK